MIRSIKQHYHWLVAALVFLEMVVFGGLINSASIYVQPISLGLGVSTTAYSVAMMPYTVSCCISTSLSGYLFSKFGCKKCALISLVLVAVSLVLTACSQNLYIFCFSKILFGIGYGACFIAGAVRIVQNWFHKHQGLVLGAVSMATGLGGSLMTLLLNRLIQDHGWQIANAVTAGIVLVIALSYLLLKDRPEQMSLKPYGCAETVKAKKANPDPQWPGLPMKQQLRQPMFYLMCLGVLVSCVCLYTTSNFITPHFTSQGYTDDEAALFQSLFLFSLGVVKLLIGYVYDRFGGKPVMIGCMSCAIIGQGLLGLTNHSGVSVVAVILFSIGLCMGSMSLPLVTASLFGHDAALQVNGIFLGLSSLAPLFSNPISSLCFDALGVYTPVYRIAPVVNLGVLGLFLLLYRLSKNQRLAYTKNHP